MPLKDRLYPVPVLGTLVRLQDRYEDDDADQYAAAIAFFAFLSLFPLIALVLSLAAFVVADQPDAPRRITRWITGAVPALRSLLQQGETPTTVGAVIEGLVERRGRLTVVSLVPLLLAGMKVVGAATAATNQAFHIRRRLSGVRRVLHQLGALVLLGLLAIGGVAASSAVGVAVGVVDISNPLLSLGGTVLTLALDFLLFLVAYRILAAGPGPAWQRLWPGALLAGTGWTVLKIFGATYVASQLQRFAFAGALASIIGLLLLLYLAGRLYLYGAELSALLYAPGADMAARRDDVDYRGEASHVLPHGPLRARPGEEPGLAPPRRSASVGGDDETPTEAAGS